VGKKMKNKVMLITLILLSLIASTSIAMAASKPTATFTANHVSGYAPLAVQFTSKTTGSPTSYFWVFEPQTSSDWNSHHAVTAAHTFKNPGVYDISLVVTNKAGSTTATKYGYITVWPKITKPVADFYCSTTYISYLPTMVRFTDASSGSVSSYLWNFGDGTTSTAKNPVHRYYDWPSYRPSFRVTETVSNPAGSSTARAYIDTAYYYYGYGSGAKLQKK
jgi:PKD repeat protein